MLKSLKKNIVNAEKTLDSIEKNLEEMNSRVANRKNLSLADKRLAEELLIQSEEVAAACDELREILGKKRIQTEKV